MNQLVKKIIKAVLTEEELNNPALTRARLAKCQGGCPKYNEAKKKCRGCGCYVEIKAELKNNYNPKKGMRLEVTHCPDGLWPDSNKGVINYYKRLDGEPTI